MLRCERTGAEALAGAPAPAAGAVETVGAPARSREAASGSEALASVGAAPAPAAANARAAAGLGMAMVLGTTGLDESETAAVKQAAEKIPVVWSPNMSLGVNVLFALARQAAGILGVRYDVEIVEAHHKHKKDAPSGTALRLAHEVAAGRNQDFEAAAVYGRRGQTGERPAGQIAIHSLRLGDVVGDHTISFAVDGERLELSHHATSRDAFAVGALRAAMWVAGRKPGLYDMRDVLGM